MLIFKMVTLDEKARTFLLMVKTHEIKQVIFIKKENSIFFSEDEGPCKEQNKKKILISMKE